MNSPSVAITIPVHKERPDELEGLSLARCVEVLGDHPLIFVGPESLDFAPYLSQAGHASVERFPDHYFRTYVGYNILMLSREFYSRFKSFTYILKHELDAFVFRDELAYWCGRGFDYIGAPWWDPVRGRWYGVGNGGFCLRSVAGSLAVLDSSRREDPTAYWGHMRSAIANPVKRALRYPWKVACHLGLGYTVRSYLPRYIEGNGADLLEDHFWGLHARRFCPEFRIAPLEEAFQFSAETEAVRVWNEGGYGDRSPFGCHRVWYLRSIHRYLYGDEPAGSEWESLVWDWVAMAGLKRLGAVGSSAASPPGEVRPANP